MKIPGDKEIRALHEKHAPSAEAFELVYTHCEIVCDIAEQLLSSATPGTSLKLVRAGSLLHDIGVYRLYDADGQLDHSRYVQHGVLGHELLAREGIPEIVARFCSHHTGVGLSRDDVRHQDLPLPVADYLAESEEESLVMYADKFHSKTEPPVFVKAEAYAASIRRFGEEKMAAFEVMRQRFGTPDLAPLAAKYGYAIKGGGARPRAISGLSSGVLAVLPVAVRLNFFRAEEVDGDASGFEVGAPLPPEAVDCLGDAWL